MFKSKPWIISAIQKSITVKKKLLKRLINVKDSQTKKTFHRQYKDYRNVIYTTQKKQNRLLQLIFQSQYEQY